MLTTPIPSYFTEEKMPEATPFGTDWFPVFAANCNGKDAWSKMLR